jgi:oligosaccharide reducing-end xylanase
MCLYKIKSSGLVAMAAAAALVADPEIGKSIVQELWDAPIPSVKWRDDDGMLYMLAMLHDSGNFKIYIQG